MITCQPTTLRLSHLNRASVMSNHGLHDEFRFSTKTVADSYPVFLVKDVQVSILNRIFKGVAFYNDNGGMEFYSKSSQAYMLSHIEEDVASLRSQLDNYQKRRIRLEIIIGEKEEHLEEWRAAVHGLEQHLESMQQEMNELIARGKQGLIDAEEREHRRHVLHRQINTTKGKIKKVTKQLSDYEACCFQYALLDSLISEAECKIAAKEKSMSALSTITVEKPGLLTFFNVVGMRSSGCCVFFSTLDYLAYIHLLKHAGRNELPRKCDCIVLNNPKNLWQLLLSVDTYDSIYCFFPDTNVGNVLQSTIIQRDSPRAVGMVRHYAGKTTLAEYVTEKYPTFSLEWIKTNTI